MKDWVDDEDMDLGKTLRRMDKLKPAKVVTEQPRRCEALARKGTGTGTCNLPLDEHGYCAARGEHISDAPEAPPGVTWNELKWLEEGLR